MTSKTAKSPTSAPLPDDSALRQFIGYNMKRTYLTIQTDLLTVLDEFGLRPTAFAALVLIVDNPDMTQSQLANGLSIERSGVVLLVDELENRELITRNRVPGDRRTYALRGTLAGTQVREKAIAAVKAHEDRLFRNISTAHRGALLGTLMEVEAQNANSSGWIKR